MPRPPAAHPWTVPRPGVGRGAPIVYRPHGIAAGPPRAPGIAAPPGDVRGTVLPRVAAWLTPDERLRVEAAGQDAYATIHFDDLGRIVHALRTDPFDAILVSVALLARGGRPAGEALAALLHTAPTLPTAALVSEPVDLATILGLGRAGVRAVVDVRRPEGWTTLRTLVAASVRSDVARLAARALDPLVGAATSDVRRFVAALFEAPARVVTVRDLARGLGVLPTTLMSRFFRAALPPPKRYLAFARLTRAAALLRTPAWTVATVADHLEYSSAQGFSRHLHLVLGMRPAEFRRRYDAHAMLARFGDDLLRPYLHVLGDFWPLTGAPAAPPRDHPLPPARDRVVDHAGTAPDPAPLARPAPGA